jgi:hypothetical protein
MDKELIYLQTEILLQVFIKQENLMVSASINGKTAVSTWENSKRVSNMVKANGKSK